MKLAYTFSVIRYVHDVVTGEFVNVGVVLYCPAAARLLSSTNQAYRRVSAFFAEIDGDHFRNVMRRLDARLAELDADLVAGARPGADLAAGEIISRVIPRDDSSLQASPGGSGLSADLEATLQQVYERYVTRYIEPAVRQMRSDAAVLGSLKRHLQASHVFAKVRPITIPTPEYELQFPISWQNGQLNVCDAVSFDFRRSDEIVGKADRWVGRAWQLARTKRGIKVHLIVGRPSDPAMGDKFERAVRVLQEMPGNHHVLPEERSDQLAKEIERDLRAHDVAVEHPVQR